MPGHRDLSSVKPMHSQMNKGRTIWFFFNEPLMDVRSRHWMERAEAVYDMVRQCL
jgi:hypothetical protein